MKVLIIGAGAAGCIAAGAAARRGQEVTVLERNPRPARKVMITGKGRCNLTNNCTVEEFIRNVRHNGRFLYSALSAFTPQDTMALLEEQGVPLKTERGNRVFPVSDKAVDVVDGLVRYAQEGGARFRQGRAVSLLIEDGICAGAVTEDGVTLHADRVVVATGGCSYPGTGSTGDGYELARQAGHTVIPVRPSLVALESPDLFCLDMQGLAPKNCGFTVTDNRTGKVIYSDRGEMLFTHFGVSGPMVLSASAHMEDMEPGRYTLHLDWKPALTPEQLDARIVRDMTERQNMDLGNALGKLLPRLLIPVILRLCDIPEGKKCNALTREERHRLGTTLKHMPVAINGFRPMTEAIVTAGGVSVREVNARTMASRILPGLRFAGEVLDVDAYTGGFNLQIAFSTGMAAGDHIDEY
ncbi:MAG: NAD(P)/FAD-dependent oxidoreductase [Ruminococcaceae bacterium]|nr:NAD(P)/FAD-dependent oxidoreductase [Oscillospiraceae bacterium]